MSIIAAKKKVEEPLDRNKSTLTHKLTALAAGHLSVMGCKPIETEVQVSPGWIADVAGFTYPTMTEAKRGKLLKKTMVANPFLNGLGWSRGNYFAYEYLAKRHLFPLTAVVEVKISKADLKKDIERKFSTTVANMNYIIIPQAMHGIAEELLDEGTGYRHKWAFIIAANDGGRIIKSDIPQIQPTSAGETLDIVAQIAIRRCHRTDKAWLRAMLKEYRATGKL